MSFPEYSSLFPIPIVPSCVCVNLRSWFESGSVEVFAVAVEEVQVGSQFQLMARQVSIQFKQQPGHGFTIFHYYCTTHFYYPKYDIWAIENKLVNNPFKIKNQILRATSLQKWTVWPGDTSSFGPLDMYTCMWWIALLDLLTNEIWSFPMQQQVAWAEVRIQLTSSYS